MTVMRNSLLALRAPCEAAVKGKMMRGFPGLSTAACWAAALWVAAAATAALAAPIATRQTAFHIPFHVQPPVDPLQRPVEVQLYVSEDRGATWQLHSRVLPNQKQFAFRAYRDGEYWFLVRTKDQSGQIHPDNTARPEMKVLVDTSVPNLRLNAVRGPAGEILVRWQSSDPNLRPENLKIDYQTAGGADVWQTLALDPAKMQTAIDQCTGETIAWPKQSGEALTIRAEIVDSAGNRAVAHAQVAASAPPAVRAFGQTVGGITPTTPPSFSSAVPATANPSAAPPGVMSPLNAMPAAVTSLPAATRWPADLASQTPLTASTAAPLNRAPYVVERLPGDRSLASSGIQPPAYTSPKAMLSSSTQSAQTPNPTASDNGESIIQPPLAEVRRDQPTSQVASADATSGSLESPTQATSRPRMVNSRTFQIDYDVGTAGVGGVQKVELWGTRDNGLHWIRYGADTDNATPLAATVEGEGTYGFRILVQSASGMIEFPPKSGDRPEIWVGVDLTRPTCRLTAIEQGRAEQAGAIDFRWEAWDRAPADRPITLSYSEQPTGPWTVIATGLENTGHYTWPLDSRVPERIYIRLEMRDQAGNVEITQTTQPIVLEHVRPKGRIREVRPNVETSRGPKTYRFF